MYITFYSYPSSHAVDTVLTVTPLLRITGERPKVHYKGDSLYPSWLNTEKEHFLAKKFTITGNSVYPASL